MKKNVILLIALFLLVGCAAPIISKYELSSEEIILFYGEPRSAPQRNTCVYKIDGDLIQKSLMYILTFYTSPGDHDLIILRNCIFDGAINAKITLKKGYTYQLLNDTRIIERDIDDEKKQSLMVLNNGIYRYQNELQAQRNIVLQQQYFTQREETLKEQKRKEENQRAFLSHKLQRGEQVCQEFKGTTEIESGLVFMGKPNVDTYEGNIKVKAFVEDTSNDRINLSISNILFNGNLNGPRTGLRNVPTLENHQLTQYKTNNGDVVRINTKIWDKKVNWSFCN